MAALILNLGVRWKWSVSSSDRFTLGGRDPSTHWIWDYVGTRAGLDVEFTLEQAAMAQRGE